MTLRAKIMHCIAHDVVVIDDIVAAIDDTPERIRSNLHAARHEELISYYLDDDTQRPAYKLTEHGRQWLMKNKAPSDTEKAASVPVNAGSESESEASAGEVAKRVARLWPPGAFAEQAKRSLDSIADVQDLAAGLSQEVDEAEALRDMLSSARIELEMLREALDVPVEPHQSLFERMLDAAKLSVAHFNDCRKWETSMMQAIGEDGIADVVAAINRLKAEPGRERTARIALEEQVQSLHAALDNRESTMYLVRAPKADLRLVFRLERAVEKAKSCARKTGRADVFALLPVGRAIQGAEWREVK